MGLVSQIMIFLFKYSCVRENLKHWNWLKKKVKWDKNYLACTHVQWLIIKIILNQLRTLLFASDGVGICGGGGLALEGIPGGGGRSFGGGGGRLAWGVHTTLAVSSYSSSSSSEAISGL